MTFVNQQDTIETLGFKIDEQSKSIYESVYGKRALELTHTLYCIENELSRTEVVAPHILFQLIRGFFKSIKSQDPLPLHQDIARRILQNEYEGKTIDPSIIDLLAREIAETYNAIGEKLFPIPWLEKAEQALEKKAQKQDCGDSVLNIIEIEGPGADKDCFDKKGLFIPLQVYLTFLEGMGKGGKEHAKKIEKREVGASSEFWFVANRKQETDHFFHSSAFLGLARIIWEDKVKKRVEFDGKYPISVVKPTFEILTSLFGAEKKENPSTIDLVNGTDIVGQIQVPLVPDHLVRQVFKGAGKFDTVIGHRAIRYAATIPFDQKLKGVPDYRVKEFDGGFVELGETLGIKNGRQFDELREIMYALKHLEITNIRDSRVTKGRLLDVTHFRSQKTRREDGLIITVLPTLVAYGEINATGILLVPMATIAPPIHEVAPNQYHASLYYLQMILVGEFSEKSKEYSQYGCIKISSEDWDRLLIKSNIPTKYKGKIIERWVRDGDDAPQVLECVEKDHFKLANAYSKMSKFLMEQGELRIKQSFKGIASAEKKKNKNR